MKSSNVRILWTLIVIVLGVASYGNCQIPDEFTNLQVLPRGIEKGDLVAAMKSYTRALGVRCVFCHDGKEGAPLSTYDFASDKPEHKKVARQMMKMTQDINKKYLAELGKPAERLVSVTCATCHHGLNEPVALEDVLQRTLMKDGIAAATQKYQDLRKDYYGSYAFDFSEDPLNRLASSLAAGGKTAEGIEFLKLNEKYFPKSEEVQFLMGEIYLKSGQKEEALKRYKKCFEMDPSNDYVKKKIDELTQPSK